MTSERYLLVRVLKWEFLVPEAAVCSISSQPMVLPIPASPIWLAGIMQVGETAVPIIDLSLRLGLGDGAPLDTALILKTQHAEAEVSTFGLVIDKVLASVSIRHGDIRPVRVVPHQPFRKFTTGIWRGRSRNSYLLDLESVFSPESFPILRALIHMSV